MASAKSVQLHELHFEPFLTAEQIQQRVTEIGLTLRQELTTAKPVYLIMLKGAFVFAADLIRAINIPAEVDFVRTSSYVGTTSSREVKLLLPPTPALVKDHDVVLIEDIIDSGYTMQAFLPQLHAMGPRSIRLVTLLHKPTAQKVPVAIDQVGFVIPNKFVVGYGLDYNGLGRQLSGIYQLSEEY
ncbi:MAG: hypoxanthine phosphoribosyltransferase [Bacteroidota bacterium]